MSDYYDFYDNTSEFEETIGELKQSLMKSIKTDFLNEMEELKSRIKELESVRENWDELEYQHEKKMRELENEKSQLAYKMRKESLASLMQDQKIIVYKVKSEYVKFPKCDKCDDNRQISYISPLGRKLQENCDCNKNKETLSPVPYIYYEFKIDDYSGKLRVWYKELKSSSSYSYFEGETMVASDIYTAFMEFEDISHYRTVFESLEDCQKYCDWFNNKSQYR